MYKRGSKKVARVTVKPPPMAQETLRVQTLMCADFLWEIERMDKEAGIRDLSLEVMPYTSARMYMQKRNVPAHSRRDSGTNGRTRWKRSSTAARTTRRGCSSPRC